MHTHRFLDAHSACGDDEACARCRRCLWISMIMLIGNNRSIMKKKVNGRLSNTLGGITTIAMSIAALALLLTLGTGL
jgi:hypothetical protein